MKCGVHNHSTWSDGKNTPDEMAKTAFDKGIESFGFSEHAISPFDPGCANITQESQQKYFSDIRRLQEQYKGVMDIFLGLEIESVTPYISDELDYMIGSVHMIESGGNYYHLDSSVEKYKRAIHDLGSIEQVLKIYYETAINAATTLSPDIFGHFDIYKKLNKGGIFFDVTSSSYQEKALDALDAVIDTETIIEVNTGGISRGYITEPYPAPFLLKRVKERNAPIIITSDAHRAENIDFGYKDTRKMLLEIGFTNQMKLTADGFISVPL